VEYLLHDQPVRFLKGKLRLRQVTRLTETGHQTPIVTSRWELRAIVVAHRMFERWRQENFFKYLREEYLIDALADYQFEPDDPTRSVPNPAQKAVVKEIHAARVHLRKLRERYGATAIDYINGPKSTDSGFEIAEKKIRMETAKATNRIKKLKARRDSLPARVTVADAQKGQKMMRLSTERKHLTNVLKMVAYQTESDLVELIRPHYSRVEDEGRTFIQMALQDTADIEPTDDQLQIRLAPLSSPHRSRALESLAMHSTKQTRCSRAPGFKCTMWSHPPVSKQKTDRFPNNHVRSSELTEYVKIENGGAGERLKAAVLKN
jgi:Transposase protein